MPKTFHKVTAFFLYTIFTVSNYVHGVADIVTLVSSLSNKVTFFFHYAHRRWAICFPYAIIRITAHLNNICNTLFCGLLYTLQWYAENVKASDTFVLVMCACVCVFWHRRFDERIDEILPKFVNIRIHSLTHLEFRKYANAEIWIGNKLFFC